MPEHKFPFPPVDDDKGIEQEVDESEGTPEEELKDARDSKPTLQKMGEGAAAKYIRGRWDRLEDVHRERMAELKVNKLRYKGYAFAQVHPNNPNRVFVPDGSARKAPSVNKIRRTVHRYMAQVTADEPIIEGTPATHTDESRDAAEAATHALRGEWMRMGLQRELQRAVQFAAIFRSAFWFFEWDDTEGGRVKAQKFFTDEEGERFLAPVDSDGNRVDDPEDAATIWQGNITVESMTPFNVRWTGGRYTHTASEVMVAKLVTLRDLYDTYPKTRKAKIRTLLAGRPDEAQKWLEDIRGNTVDDTQADDDDDEILGETGETLEDSSSVLDEKVFLLQYFKPESRQYKKGFHGIVAGKFLVSRDKLAHGRVPVVQFKLLEEVDDPLGLSLVDLLRDPQELLDFVNSQIMRFLQSLKKQYLVPQNSGIKPRDLTSPTRAFITYNPRAGEPKPMETADIPHNLPEWVDRFDREFQDQAGIHDTMAGKHVPGVSSGRHAEALRSGDETILGLTRTQIKGGIEAAGQVILEMVKKEWTQERRVEYMADRMYVEKAFSGADFGETSRVRLNEATLLMLTPAQKLETLYAYAEAGAIEPRELRQLAPIADTAGISLAEDEHYKRARRQNSKFLDGPPDELVKLREKYEEDLAAAQQTIARLEEQLILREVPPEEAEETLQAASTESELLHQEWQEAIMRFSPSHEEWEQDPEIARIHFEEHAKALSQDKVSRFPEWWRQAFTEHAVTEWRIAMGPEAQQQGQPGAGASGIPTEPANIQNTEGTPVSGPPV